MLSAIDQAAAGGSPINAHEVKRVLSMFVKIAPAKPDNT